ncbi:DegT/DnrJ/EryC1/StrS family aminotransferase [Thalassospira tepidiphila]|uniref:DegT/DnrJ/EryC1/StrS family aminotransferase n=1 Tax=Thalassospira tepidiphila TaxID=393657 RepID=UPI001BCE976D
MIPFIDLQSQRREISANIDRAIASVLEHGQYVMGPEVARFEQELASFTGAKYAFSCANGTDALQLALMALGIGPGDAVFAPSFTFVATVEAVRLVGAQPVFVDVDEKTFNLCPDSLLEAIHQVTRDGELVPRAIIPVDLFGQPSDYDQMTRIAELHDLKVIADAAQSFGATFRGKNVGQLGDITTTSFFPAKPLGCYGDGGAIFTNDDYLAAEIRSLRNHGQGTDRYDNVKVGLNSRLDTLQAAILLEKLKIFPKEILKREKVANFYAAKIPVELGRQSLLSGASSVWAQYTVFCEERELIRNRLSDLGIPTAVYYPKPNHLQKPYLSAPSSPTGLKTTEYLQERVFSLPMHPYLTEETQMKIVMGLQSAFLDH